MSDSRQNFITVLFAISEWTDTRRRGFSISDLAGITPGVSEMTVRRCVYDLQEEDLVVQDEDGLYYPLTTLQSSIFDPTS